MKKKFLSVLTVILLTASLGGYASAESQKQDEPEFIKTANEIMLSTSLEDRQDLLLDAGWEVVEGQASQSDELISPMSTSGCGSIDNKPILKHWDGSTSRYVYLIHAAWDFKGSCKWDSESAGAVDVIAMAVVDGNGDAVGVQGEYAYIKVTDEDGDEHPLNGAVSGPSGSGMIFTVDDRDGPLDNVGESGEAWFYVVKPTSSTTGYYVQSTWRHTWTSTSTSLTSANITFGANSIGLNLGWSTTTIPSSWDVFDSTYATFN